MAVLSTCFVVLMVRLVWARLPGNQIYLGESLEGCRVDKLNRESQEALREARMPNKQTEDFRFTDLSVITRSTLQVAACLITHASQAIC